MILKNFWHHVRLASANWKLMWRYDVLIEKGVTAKYIDSIRFGTHCTVQSGAYLYGSRQGNPVVFGDHVVVSAHSIILGEAGVEIGAATHLGPHVVITSQFGDPRSDMTAPQAQLKYIPVKLGRGCWIGAGAVIMPGTVLGDCCIVAPNSVVYGMWGDDVKLAGNPARKTNR
jgi:acetyltransferase-like isoleucine patch superfamily enzyme